MLLLAHFGAAPLAMGLVLVTSTSSIPTSSHWLTPSLLPLPFSFLRLPGQSLGFTLKPKHLLTALKEKLLFKCLQERRTAVTRSIPVDQATALPLSPQDPSSRECEVALSEEQQGATGV